MSLLRDERLSAKGRLMGTSWDKNFILLVYS